MNQNSYNMNKKDFMNWLITLSLFIYNIICFGFVTMKSWNWLLVSQFNFPVIEYVQAACIYWFVKMVIMKKTEAKRVLASDYKEDNEWYYIVHVSSPWVILLVSYIIYLVI